MALIGYAPLGTGLLVAGYASLSIAGGGISLALASLPDIDQRLPRVRHRGVTHTVAFAVAVGAALGAMGWLVGGPSGVAPELALFGFAVGTTTILSHLLADVITPAGLTPLWPFSDAHFTLDIVRADNTLANYALFGLGILATVGVLVVARPAG